MKLTVVTTYAPQSLDVNSFRGKVFKLFLDHNQNMLSSNIRFILIGPASEYENSYDSFTWLSSDLPSKETKLDELHRWLLEENKPTDLICRLDDDDFLNPKIRESLTSHHDFVVDGKHHFYDVASGQCAKQKRSWFPNTTIMKWSVAFTEPWEKGKALLFHYDHSQSWHKYAEQEGSVVEWSRSPIYLRLVSPFSITSSNDRSGQSSKSMEVDWMKYFSYRIGFGDWGSCNSKEAFPLVSLKSLWEEAYGAHRSPSKIERWRVILASRLKAFKM